MVTVIDGRKIAGEIISNLKNKPVSGKWMGSLIISETDASRQFLKQRDRIAKKLKIQTFVCRRTKESCPTTEDLAEEIRQICEYPAVGGVNVHLPLPSVYNREHVLTAINPLKDINRLNIENNYVLPPSIMALERILESLNYDLAGKRVVMVGSGFLIGAPIADYLKNKIERLTVFRSKNNLVHCFEAQVLKEADLVITGVGKPGILKSEMLNNNTGVIDFGNGDFDASEFLNSSTNKLLFYTPTPGGTGPILTACLFENFYRLSELQ